MGPDDSVPLLRSARGLQALSITPGKNFFALFACLYNIVREISYAGPTEWLFGGARAGVAAPSSAFITCECIRGLLNLQKGLEYSKRICHAIASFIKRNHSLRELLPDTAFEPWLAQENKRTLLSLEIEFSDLIQGAFIPNRYLPEDLKIKSLTTKNVQSSLLQVQEAIKQDVDSALADCERLFKAIRAEREKDKTPNNPDKNVQSSLLQVQEAIRQNTDSALADCEKLLEAIKAERGRGKTPPNPDEMNRIRKNFNDTESAHRHAIWLIEKVFYKNLKAISRKLRKKRGTLLDSNVWEEVAEIFSDCEEELKHEVRGPSLYMESVLEAELARSSGKDGAFDVGQLAFAAASFAVLKNIGPEQRDDRLERAAKLIGSRIDENGGIPSGRPVLTLPKGYEMHVVVPEIIRVFGELLTRVSTPVTPDLVRRLIRHFRNTKIELGSSGLIGFGFEEQKNLPKAFWWLTAISFIALHRVVRMLDCCINERVRHHFSVKNFSSSSINLDSFFYPDYGLAAYLSKKSDREPISQLLLQFHAHLNRVKLPFNPSFSAILYGPPGTGKTTMLEALAHALSVSGEKTRFHGCSKC